MDRIVVNRLLSTGEQGTLYEGSFEGNSVYIKVFPEEDDYLWRNEVARLKKAKDTGCVPKIIGYEKV